VLLNTQCSWQWNSRTTTVLLSNTVQSTVELRNHCIAEYNPVQNGTREPMHCSKLSQVYIWTARVFPPQLQLVVPCNEQFSITPHLSARDRPYTTRCLSYCRLPHQSVHGARLNFRLTGPARPLASAIRSDRASQSLGDWFVSSHSSCELVCCNVLFSVAEDDTPYSPRLVQQIGKAVFHL
jgi:hypothetical protein